jgi:hypothetical protein
MVGGQRPIEPTNRILNSPKWKNGRQHWEIQPFVAEINLHYTKFDLSNKNQSQNLIKPETNAENECSNKKKRSHKTSCGLKLTLKTHATKNGHPERMLKNQSQNLMQLKTDAENECSNNKQSEKIKLMLSKKLRQSQKLNLLLSLQKLLQSQKLNLLLPLQKLAVTKAKVSTAVTKAHAVRKAQNLINRPLQKLEMPNFW